jgi:signal transduction histidine kinase
LFRIAREAVINAAVHGGSRRIEMRLREERDGVALLVRSDGDPVDPAAVEAPPGHIGVRLMIERAHAQGGTCTIEPDGQSGTVVRAWLPRREA